MALPAAAMLARAASAGAGAATSRSAAPLAALAFDGLALFDPRPVWARVERVLPEKGAALGNAWRARQFEYQWLHALGGQYVDFWQATDDALRFAARQTGLVLTANQREELMQGFAEMKPWPDVESALKKLRALGLRLSVLSNFTPAMLASAMKRGGIAALFEKVISTDVVRSYKPAPATYQLASDAMSLPRDRIGFVAFAGWDVAGAKWFGYPTFWLNRARAMPEELGAAADYECNDMPSLVAFLQP